MIIVLKRGATREVADELLARIQEKGCKPLYMPGSERVVLGALGDERVLAELALGNHPMVEEVKPILAPYKLVSREVHPHDTIVDIGGIPVGGHHFVVIAGPSAIENREHMMATADAVTRGGAAVLRGGAYRPRSSPYSFQGLGEAGLVLLSEAGRTTGLPTVSEVVDVADLDAVAAHADCIQVGARNMQNYGLLRAVGQVGKPVLLKRGHASRIKDFLLAAEYIVGAGSENVILCERGIRTFETATPNTLDLNAIPFVKQRSHLPIIVDPSRGTGIRELVAPMAKAAAACGADGIIVDVHHDPSQARSQASQSLAPPEFEALMRELRPIASACGKEMS